MSRLEFDDVADWIRGVSSLDLEKLLDELHVELRGRGHTPEADLVELAMTVLNHRLSGQPPRLNR